MPDLAVPAPAAAEVIPEILAPAGDAPSFLAALAAGADAIYLGLKHFSARMQPPFWRRLPPERTPSLLA